MADFKLLLDAQKETNKQLALLRQQQMQVAKDPPEKFTEGEEFKATALHIASERLSGMHDTDDEVKELRKEIKEDSKKEQKSLGELKTELGEKVGNPLSKLQGRVGDIVEDAGGNRQLITGVSDSGKALTGFVSKQATLSEAREKYNITQEKLINGFVKTFQFERKRDEEILNATKRLGFFTPERLSKALSDDLGNTLSQIEKDKLVANAARQKEEQKERIKDRLYPNRIVGSLLKGLGGIAKGIFKGAGLATKGFFATLLSAGALFGLSYLVRRLPLFLDKINEFFGEDGIGKTIDKVVKFFKELFEKIGLAFDDPDGFVEGIKKQFPQLEEAFNRIKEEIDKFIEEFEATMKTFFVAAGLVSLLLLFTPTGKIFLAITALTAAFVALQAGIDATTKFIDKEESKEEITIRRDGGNY